MISNVLKLLILGMPGSGKSTVAQWIRRFVYQEHETWSTSHLNDYGILRGMFLRDQSFTLFEPGSHGSFIVRYPSVYDEALRTLEQHVEDVERQAKGNQHLLLVEFARSNYQHAFTCFSPGFLDGAYFLFLDAAINTCIQRTYQRIRNPRTENDYFVAEHVFERYYRNRNKEYLYSPSFRKEYRVDAQRFKGIRDTGQMAENHLHVLQFVNGMLLAKTQKQPVVEREVVGAGHH